MRFLPPDHDVIRATVLAIADDLTDHGLVLRYRVEETDDGLHGEEGAFAICSFLLVSALSEIGEPERARALCERLLALAGPLGLYAEEIDPASGVHLGNFPQAFTHLALINAVAHVVADEQREVGRRPDRGLHGVAPRPLTRRRSLSRASRSSRPASRSSSATSSRNEPGQPRAQLAARARASAPRPVSGSWTSRSTQPAKRLGQAVEVAVERAQAGQPHGAVHDPEAARSPCALPVSHSRSNCSERKPASTPQNSNTRRIVASRSVAELLARDDQHPLGAERVAGRAATCIA